MLKDNKSLRRFILSAAAFITVSEVGRYLFSPFATQGMYFLFGLRHSLDLEQPVEDRLGDLVALLDRYLRFLALLLLLFSVLALLSAQGHLGKHILESLHLLVERPTTALSEAEAARRCHPGAGGGYGGRQRKASARRKRTE